MKRQVLAVGFCLVSFLVTLILTIGVSAQSPKPSSGISKIFVFGDSLSDIGNSFQGSNGTSPPSPPYFQGRFSNGPIWAEYLASDLNLKLQLGQDFAFGGATITEVNTGIPSLRMQIKRFTQANSKADANALYAIWAGANDYLRGADSSGQALADLSLALNELTAAGARKIIVANLPDLGKLPSTVNTSRSESLSSLVQAHNLGLVRTLETLRQRPGSSYQVLLLDANTLFKQAVANPNQFGFSDVRYPCLIEQAVCNHPEQFLFWDGIHPTTAAHRHLARLASTLLKPEDPREVQAAETETSTSRFDPAWAVLALGVLGGSIILYGRGQGARAAQSKNRRK
ncbi:SGNH/GDSL hydrolase family protein [Leptolyngbya sp. FACHB-261]|uniref:SGNH/GDSL hydrolase family protein n=1 Tax=Leptolyngbya sp. FACHB-261 TaxID=2692806 RepID=UPI001687F9F9|nr:SGNH/GDSL hydrolase family protein [Leptolyngbya sp. FACHB-261]MBD2099850.1 SGNH/GDSL hydrolase family protein [Leptolyngbya sp. FACHB-261]